LDLESRHELRLARPAFGRPRGPQHHSVAGFAGAAESPRFRISKPVAQQAPNSGLDQEAVTVVYLLPTAIARQNLGTEPGRSA
jgi:hypothetical protein